MATIVNNLSHLVVLKDTIGLAYDQISSDVEIKKKHSYELDEFWNIFLTSVKMISHEATKICMAISKPPIPPEEEIKALANGLESACLALITVYCGLSEDKGKTLHETIKNTTLRILKSIQDFCLEISQNVSGSQLKAIGSVWEQCTSVSSLPRSNKDAVLEIVINQLSAVDDALNELEESIKVNSSQDNSKEESSQDISNDEYSEEEWTETDKLLLPNSKGLLKASIATLKKSKGLLSSLEPMENSAALDQLAELFSTVSCAVDEFVLSIYAPIDHSVLKTNGFLLADTLKKILKLIRDSEFSGDYSWTEFLLHAVDHNIEKIVDFALEN